MDDTRIRQSLRQFIRRHRTNFQYLPTIQSQLLELGALVITVEHYRLAGYGVAPTNLIQGRFKVKRSSAGYPWRFSWFTIERGAQRFEVHTNLKVAGAHGDDASYVLDVAVCRPDRVPTARPANAWSRLRNEELITWVEAKKLVVYPMLLAQFIGIVHEVSPRFLAGRLPWGFARDHHFAPTLVTTGHLAAGSRDVCRGFVRRNFRIVVVPDLDVSLAELQHGPAARSPFVDAMVRIAAI